MNARKLGFVAAAAIVVANMIGTGVWTSTGFQAMSLHDGGTMLIAWLAGGVLALFGAAAYAELGAMMPQAGGEYVYLREAYHPIVGFLSGWVSLFAGFSAPIAVAAIAFGKYTSAIGGGFGPDTQKMLGVALVLAMTGLHAFDTVIGGRVQAVFSIAKASLIVVFVAAGLLFGDGSWSHFSARAGGTSNVWTEDFAVSLMFVTFAYSGWNAAAYIAGDIERPQKNVPRALLAGTALVTALYLLLNVTFLYALSPEQLGAPIVEVGDASASALFNGTVAKLISSLVALGLISAVSAMVMAGPRVYAAMAEDGALPAMLARRSRRGTPWIAIALQGVLASAIVLYGDLEHVIEYVGFLLSIFAALAVAAVIVLRRTRPKADRPYRTNLVTPVLFVAATAWVTYAQVVHWTGHVSWGIGTLVSGVVVWLIGWWMRRKPR